MIVTSGNRFVIFSFSYFTFKYIISALLLKSFIVTHILMNTHLQLHEIVLKVPLHFYPHTISMNVYSLFFPKKTASSSENSTLPKYPSYSILLFMFDFPFPMTFLSKAYMYSFRTSKMLVVYRKNILYFCHHNI